MEDFAAEIKGLKNSTKKVIGCFPLYPPLELFHSMGLTPVVLWGMPDPEGQLAESDQHVQNYACSVGRNITQLVLSDLSDTLDGLFMYNACDTLRNLPEILTWGLEEKGKAIPVFKMHLPASNPGDGFGRDYLDKRISMLIQELEMAYDVTFSEKPFLESTELYRKMRLLTRELEKKAQKAQIPFDLFINITQEQHTASVEDQIRLLEHHLNEQYSSDVPDSASPVMVSGITPPSPELLKLFSGAGLRIVVDDIAAMHRSNAYIPEASGSPGDYYSDFFQNHFPCTTLLHQQHSRFDVIMKLIEETSVRGFIFIGTKFCEHEYFEIPSLERAIKEKGIHFLALETSVGDTDNINAMRTRIEAFSELLAN